jgi:hypothetical protein
MWIARPELAAAVLATASALSGCAPQPSAGAGIIRFEVTNLQKPPSTAPVIAENGAVIDLPLVFTVNVKIRGDVAAGASDLRVTAASYTPECNGIPAREAYRNKVLHFPYSVTSVSGANGVIQSWPISTATLVALAGCRDPEQPWYPSTRPVAGTLQLDAEVQQAGGTLAASELTFRIGNPQQLSELPPPTGS